MSLLASRKRKNRSTKIDLGVDAPMCESATLDKDDLDGQGFHFGWFTSLILAGLAGFGLMLGALYTASDQNLKLVTSINKQDGDTKITASGQADRTKYGAQKTNRLAIVPLLTQVQSIKETLEVSSVENYQGSQIIRVSPYTRISTDLARTRTQLTQDLESFNPISLMTAAAEIQKGLKSREGEELLSNNESEVTLSVTALSPDIVYNKKDWLEDERVVEQIFDFVKKPDPTIANFGTDVSNQTISLADIIESSAPASSYEQLGNIQEVKFMKTPFSALVGDIEREEVYSVIPDDELTLILSQHGVLELDLTPILDAINLRFDIDDLAAGQLIKIGFGYIDNQQTASRNLKPIRVSISNENKMLVSVGRTSSGRFVPLDTETAQNTYVGDSISLYHSIYETALRAKVPEQIIQRIIHIFSFDIDYKKQIAAGDKLTLIFDRRENELEEAELLYAGLSIGGTVKEFFRFETPDDGYIDYYDMQGRSAKKFLLRKPMHSGKFRSGFGMRRHPITRSYRMHAGVDWSAPTGTPIVAAGDGRITKRSWAGGYGRQVKIQHKHGYVSSYSHMRRYGPGISEGSYVRQGQVIGYVGTSGLSTGPHLHYELIVNNRKVDPLGIRLPRGRSLSGDILAQYEVRQKRILEIIDMPSQGDSLGQAKANSISFKASEQPLPLPNPLRGENNSL